MLAYTVAAGIRNLSICFSLSQRKKSLNFLLLPLGSLHTYDNNTHSESFTLRCFYQPSYLLINDFQHLAKGQSQYCMSNIHSSNHLTNTRSQSFISYAVFIKSTIYYIFSQEKDQTTLFLSINISILELCKLQISLNVDLLQKCVDCTNSQERTHNSPPRA